MVLSSADAGVRQAIATGQYSDQYGYQIVYDFSVNSVLVQKATLTLTAQPASFYIGQAIQGLKGTLSGFVAGESIKNAVTGDLQWKTNANNALTPGQYAIEGTGISAKNYVINQADGNSTALGLNALAPASVYTKAIALTLKPQGLPIAPREITNRPVVSTQYTETDPIAALTTDTLAAIKGSSVYEFCFPKPPSMLSVVSVTCVRAKQR